MSRVAYVDGRYLPHRSAAVHIENRGYQFADGVYEVMAVVGGAPVDEEPHLMRLARSLTELQIVAPSACYLAHAAAAAAS
jgi:D-alanine transaminase